MKYDFVMRGSRFDFTAYDSFEKLLNNFWLVLIVWLICGKYAQKPQFDGIFYIIL